MNFLGKVTAKLFDQFKTKFPNLCKKLPLFIDLTRLNRPIGIYLLLWPTITALWIAAAGVPALYLLTIFTLGTIAMRSAGCCMNDFADYNFDGSVQRTEKRPLVDGSLKRHVALLCFSILSGISFVLVLFTNIETVILSFYAAAIIVIYPFVKRYTNLPQLVLGVAFSWGILMAFTATISEIPRIAYLLFSANVLWTIAYDTQYAMVDREFDIKIGVKSTAILFGDADRIIIGVLQGGFIVILFLAALQLQLNLIFYISLAVASLLLSYQQYLIKDRLPASCFKAFLNNNWVGAVILIGTILNYF